MEGRGGQWSNEEWQWEPYTLQAYPRQASAGSFKEPLGKRQRLFAQAPESGVNGRALSSYEYLQNFARARQEAANPATLTNPRAVSLPALAQQTQGYSQYTGAGLRENVSPGAAAGGRPPPSRSSTSGCSGSGEHSAMTTPASPALARAVSGMQLANNLSRGQQPPQQQAMPWGGQPSLALPRYPDEPLQRQQQPKRYSQTSLLLQQQLQQQRERERDQQQHSSTHLQLLQAERQQQQQQQLAFEPYNDAVFIKPEPLASQTMSYPQPRQLQMRDPRYQDEPPRFLGQVHSTPVLPTNRSLAQQQRLAYSSSAPAYDRGQFASQRPFGFGLPDSQPAQPLGLLHIGSSLGSGSTHLTMPMRPLQHLPSSHMAQAQHAQQAPEDDPFFAALMEEEAPGGSPGQRSPSTVTDGTTGTVAQEVEVQEPFRVPQELQQQEEGDRDREGQYLEQWEAAQQQQPPLQQHQQQALHQQQQQALHHQQQQPLHQQQQQPPLQQPNGGDEDGENNSPGVEAGDATWQQLQEDPVPEGGEGRWQAPPPDTITILRACELPHPARMECQVADCGKSLVSLRDYHQRYRICDVHIKLEQVMKDGWLQRFCQQCSRFHPVSAFDGARRSCREQLSKHNLRRRRQRHPSGGDPPRDSPKEAPPMATARSGGGSTGAPANGCTPNTASTRAGDLASTLEATKGELSKSEMAKLVAELREQPERLNSLTALVVAAGFDGCCSSSHKQGQGGQPLSYVPQHTSLRMSFKLFKKTPADLPLDLQEQVCNWLGHAPAGIEGVIRPGCVHLTLQLLLDHRHIAELAASDRCPMDALLQRILHEHPPHSCWSSGRVAVQLLHQRALIQDGQVVKDGLTLGRREQRLPVLCGLGALAVDARESRGLELIGSCLGGPRCVGIVRANGHVLLEQACSGPQVGSDNAVLQLPCASGCQLAFVEVDCDGVLTQELPLLLLDDQLLVDEVNRLRQLELSTSDLHAVLLDLGLALQAAAGLRPPYLTRSMLASKVQQLLPLLCRHSMLASAARLRRLTSGGVGVRHTCAGRPRRLEGLGQSLAPHTASPCC